MSIALRGDSVELRLPLNLLVSFVGAVGAWRLHSWFLRRDDADETSATSATDFVRSGTALLRWLVDYRASCGKLPVVSRAKPNEVRDSLPSAAPERPEPFSAILSDLTTKIVPGLTHWENSRGFFAYFKPHASYPAVLGELVCAGLNVMGFDWIASPACTELEVVTLDWLAKLLHLPERLQSGAPGPGGGVIQGSAGEAAIVVLLAATRQAQQRVVRARASPDLPDNDDVGRDRCVVYSSDQTHAIVRKACMVLGLKCRALPTSATDGFKLRGATVAAACDADLAAGLLPVAVVGTSGTTTSCAFDPLRELASVCEARGLWLHVDAAYGGAYACLDEVRPLFDGVERCDSFCVNAHKKLLVPFDLAALYVADRRPLLSALALTPEYLRNAPSESGAVVDYEHWQLGLGRRFRALKLWFVLRRFGANGVRAHVRAGLELASRLAERVRQSDRLELACVSLSLVCFRRKAAGSAVEGSEADDEAQHALLEAIKARGIFIIHSRLGGRKVLRFACGGVEQTVAQVDAAFEAVDAAARSLSFSS
jgi:aromatic-L-amino-acid decarboxylase